MLLRMLPDQVKDHWDEIKVAIYEALPAYTGERSSLMNDILVSILLEQMTVWVSYQMVDKVTVVDAIATTTFVHNEFSKTKNLLLFTIFGYRDISEKSWIEGFDAGVKYAKTNGCDNIISYSSNPAILKQAEFFNCDVTSLITIPLGG